MPAARPEHVLAYSCSGDYPQGIAAVSHESFVSLQLQWGDYPQGVAAVSRGSPKDSPVKVSTSSTLGEEEEEADSGGGASRIWRSSR